MYQVGELIIYGTSGVCRVTEIGTPATLPAVCRGKLYYTLEPMFERGTIYAPVEGKVFMRPVITREKAEELIDQIPHIREEECEGWSVQQLSGHYANAFESHRCEDLIKLIKTVYTKNQNYNAMKRRLGQTDQRYWKRAEDLFYGELAAALEIDREQVPAYIEERLGAKKS